MKVSAVILAVCGGLVVSGCGGRSPQPVQAVQATDGNLSCPQIAEEVSANNNALLALVQENHERQTKNAVAGTAGVIFLPALLFMDLKGAAKEEAQALQARNAGLVKRYEAKRCSPAIKPLTMQEASAKLTAAGKTDADPKVTE